MHIYCSNVTIREEGKGDEGGGLAQQACRRPGSSPCRQSPPPRQAKGDWPAEACLFSIKHCVLLGLLLPQLCFLWRQAKKAELNPGPKLAPWGCAPFRQSLATPIGQASPPTGLEPLPPLLQIRLAQDCFTGQ